MVGLGENLVRRWRFSRVLDSAENDNWRVVAAGGVFEGLGRGGRITMIAIGVEQNQIGPMLFGELERLRRAGGFDRGGAVACEKRAQNFARFGGFVDNQHA